MVTLTVDDRKLIVTLMQGILQKLDPTGTHLGANTPGDALRLAKETPPEVAFLDVEMPGEMNGLTLGKQLKALFPKLNIVIITGHEEYALKAFELDASGYLLKPLTLEGVAHQLSVLRFRREETPEQTIRVRCFGAFEVYAGGVPLDFSYSKTKELLACLIDRNGAVCSNDTLIGCLWPDEPADQHTKARLRKCVKDLKDVFAAVGASDVIRHQERIGLGLDVTRLDCDYYRYLQGDPAALHQYRGKYMTQYAFAEETRAALEHEQSVNSGV
ncbi:MAG: response regulator [Oscillospiraceae bacterium]|nr:response regulator [Oscillospiraceae bacterium]